MGETVQVFDFTKPTDYQLPVGDTMQFVNSSLQLALVAGQYSMGTCLFLVPIEAKRITSFVHVATVLTNTVIQYTLHDTETSLDYYYDGSTWTISSGYPQSNSIETMNANISSFLDGQQTKAVYVKATLLSTDGINTPILNKVVVKYYTKIGYTFQNYTVPVGEWGEVLTADDMRFLYLWGIDLQASDVNLTEVQDEQLQWCVDEARKAWEKELNIDIRKKVYKVEPSNSLEQSVNWSEGVDYTDEEDWYDFDVVQWGNYGFVQLRHRPVLSVETAEIYDQLGNKILDLLTWMRLKKKSGQLSFYPKGSFSLNAGYAGSTVFAAWHQMFGRVYPNAFKLEYTTGYKNSDFIPGELRQIIGMHAALIALAWIGDGLLAGFSSSSLSLDGLSESFSSTQSATSAYFGARIKDYIDRIATFRKNGKYKYSNIPIGFIS